MAVTVVGIDSGFSFMKAVTATGSVIFPNVISDSNDRVLARGIGLGDDPLANLDVAVDINPQTGFFIGELALKEGDRPAYIWELDRVNSIHARAVLLTTLALFTRTDGEQFYVSTGLPVQDYVTELRGIYENSLLGEHRVTFVSGPMAGITKNFSIVHTKVSAQGLGVFFNEIITSMGTVSPTPYIRGRVGIIDLGFRTTNIIMVEEMHARRNLSQGLEVGMSDAYEYVRDNLLQHGIILDLEEMEKEFWKDLIKFRGTTIEVKPLREKALKRLAERIGGEIKRNWRRATDIQAVLVAGGGAPALFDLLDVPGKKLVRDSQMANARGFFKTALMKNIQRVVARNA